MSPCVILTTRTRKTHLVTTRSYRISEGNPEPSALSNGEQEVKAAVVDGRVHFHPTNADCHCLLGKHSVGFGVRMENESQDFSPVSSSPFAFTIKIKSLLSTLYPKQGSKGSTHSGDFDFLGV